MFTTATIFILPEMFIVKKEKAKIGDTHSRLVSVDGRHKMFNTPK